MTLWGDPDNDPEPASTAPQWHELANTTRHRCDPCVEVAFTNRRHRIGRAKWRRRVKGLDRYYCPPCANDLKTREAST